MAWLGAGSRTRGETSCTVCFGPRDQQRFGYEEGRPRTTTMKPRSRRLEVGILRVYAEVRTSSSARIVTVPASRSEIFRSLRTVNTSSAQPLPNQSTTPRYAAPA